MIQGQSFEGRREALNQSNKLSRTYTTLLEALNRHRGKGQQKVTCTSIQADRLWFARLRSRGEGFDRNRSRDPEFSISEALSHAYPYKTKELVDRFVNAARRAGVPVIQPDVAEQSPRP
jgi:hypothetical protein